MFLALKSFYFHTIKMKIKMTRMQKNSQGLFIYIIFFKIYDTLMIFWKWRPKIFYVYFLVFFPGMGLEMKNSILKMKM